MKKWVDAIPDPDEPEELTMGNTLEHELSIWSPYAQDTHTAHCTCGYRGPLRGSLLTAQVDAKQHRIETASEDDVNVKPKRKPGRPRKVAEGTIAEVAAKGAEKL